MTTTTTPIHREHREGARERAAAERQARAEKIAATIANDHGIDPGQSYDISAGALREALTAAALAGMEAAR